MTIFITTDKLNEIPALQGADPAARALALENAARVERYIQQHQWIDETDLRQYGERNGINPDAMNTALDVLQATGRLHTIDASAEPAPADPPAEKPAKKSGRRSRAKR